MYRRNLFLLLGIVSIGALVGPSGRAEMPNSRIALQNILTGDPKIDAALIQSFELGFRTGREDGLRAVASCKKSG